jgi:hypothetical protein
MTLAGYELPFDSITSDSPVAVRLGDTLPVVTAQLVKDGGPPIDADDWTGHLELVNSAGVIEMTIDASYDAATKTFYYPWPQPFDTHAEYRSEFLVSSTDATQVMHFAGPAIYAYDPALLWADPQTVIALAGGGYSTSEAVQAIYIATNAVRAWATVPVPSPVPDAVRGAVAILAARVLTTPPPGTPESVGILSERIGDYSVRYADQGRLSIEGTEVEGLLAWLRPGVYAADIGPKYDGFHSVSSGYPPVTIIEEEEVVP